MAKFLSEPSVSVSPIPKKQKHIKIRNVPHNTDAQPVTAVMQPVVYFSLKMLLKNMKEELQYIHYLK